MGRNIAGAAINGLVLVAGLSSRMGDFKPLMPLQGKTIIENTVDSMFSGGVEHIVVVTGFRADEVETVLQSRYPEGITYVRNGEYASSDMLRSIQIGCGAMLPCEAFFLLPGDMPVVKKETFQKLIRDRDIDKLVTFPTLQGCRKHPPLVNNALVPRIMAFHKEGGLRELWKELGCMTQEVPIDDEGTCIDLDTQEDYRSCLKHHGENYRS